MNVEHLTCVHCRETVELHDGEVVAADGSHECVARRGEHETAKFDNELEDRRVRVSFLDAEDSVVGEVIAVADDLGGVSFLIVITDNGSRLAIRHADVSRIETL